ncbi:phenazine biosynthesis protein [Stylonychia lemnae]|uniref:Phenazine biosynthesis protein n=1 Tax=Stylonychia lemnae TaxID=5949 RepID=A0A078A1X6_STYLE|nr:phenazine biosynthesis protein [Stylonychia lemnae]|eukprot:CDW76130.1 phenazine biosynthesis protein [Stylonychia lemnae]
MQEFAKWTNLSETTFILPSKPAEIEDEDQADYYVRIFTPYEELPFAGHPTLGSCHVFLNNLSKDPNQKTIIQECGIGKVKLTQVSKGKLAFICPKMIKSGDVEISMREEILKDLGLDDTSAVIDVQHADNGPGWVLVLFKSVHKLLELSPLQSKYYIGCASIYSKEEQEFYKTDSSVEVRTFCPGNNNLLFEDPVTGSFNAALALYLHQTKKVSLPYTATQGQCMKFNGRLSIFQEDDNIYVGGEVKDCISGNVLL